jgi:hypothetical protein
MSYYRAALAAAHSGNLTEALRLVKCSIATGENAPMADRLHRLLRIKTEIPVKAGKRLRELAVKKRYRKALRLQLPDAVNAHVARGLICCALGWRLAAQRELNLALLADSGNDLARRALAYAGGLGKRRRE